jgi:hypothetical protein
VADYLEEEAANGRHTKIYFLTAIGLQCSPDVAHLAMSGELRANARSRKFYVQSFATEEPVPLGSTDFTGELVTTWGLTHGGS